MAFFGNRQNNQKENKNETNTRGYQFMNIEGYEPSTMTISGWNDMLSIRINPALEPSKRTEGRQYDYERNVTTALNAENVYLLLKGINEKIIPAINNNEECRVGVSIANGSSLLVVETGLKRTEKITPMVILYKNLDENTRKPAISLSYEFRNNNTIDAYDEDKGKFVNGDSVRVELNMFIKILESYLMTFSKFNTHFDRLVNKYYNEKYINTLNAIANKMGIETDHNTSTSFITKKNPFTSGNSNSNINVDSINDISDLNNMLDS